MAADAGARAENAKTAGLGGVSMLLWVAAGGCGLWSVARKHGPMEVNDELVVGPVEGEGVRRLRVELALHPPAARHGHTPPPAPQRLGQRANGKRCRGTTDERAGQCALCGWAPAAHGMVKPSQASSALPRPIMPFLCIAASNETWPAGTNRFPAGHGQKGVDNGAMAKGAVDNGAALGNKHVPGGLCCARA